MLVSEKKEFFTLFQEELSDDKLCSISIMSLYRYSSVESRLLTAGSRLKSIIFFIDHV